MATFWEPPALLTLAVVLGGGGAVIYHALRPALRGPLPVVTDERDEVWGVEDPPPPPKKPYVYPADRPLEDFAAPLSDREPEPFALMPASPTVAPLRTIAAASVTPVAESSVEDDTGAAETVGGGNGDEDEEELSLSDLFRSRRRPRARRSDGPP